MLPKILIYDIETTPQLQWRWRYWDDGAPLKMVEDSKLLCFAYKWYGEKTTHFVNENVVETLWNLFDEADVIVAHNNDRFDERMANAFFAGAGYGPPSTYQAIDTLKQVRKYFHSTSSSLKELARQYGLTNKMDNSGVDLWFRCMDGEKAAWKEMKSYNIQDVDTLEQLYEMVRPWMKTGHPNMNHWSDEVVCRVCGSDKLQKRGVKRTQVYAKQQVQCQNCGAYSTFRLRGKAAGPLA